MPLKAWPDVVDAEATAVVSSRESLDALARAANERGRLAGEAQFRTGVIHFERRDFDAAETAFDDGENPAAPLAKSELRTEALYWLGRTRSERGWHLDAARTFACAAALHRPVVCASSSAPERR